MTITDRLLITIIGGFFLWAVKEIIVFLVRRKRVLNALEADIIFQQDEVADDLASITALFSGGILQEGSKIPFPLKYSPEPHMVLSAYLSCLPNFINAKSLVRLFKFYDVISEFESAMEGFCGLLCLWEDRQNQLTKENIGHLNGRLERIKSLANVITKKPIKGISDLPEDYRSVQNLETTIKSHGANTNT